MSINAGFFEYSHAPDSFALQSIISGRHSFPEQNFTGHHAPTDQSPIFRNSVVEGALDGLDPLAEQVEDLDAARHGGQFCKYVGSISYQTACSNIFSTDKNFTGLLNFLHNFSTFSYFHILFHTFLYLFYVLLFFLLF